MIRQTVLDNTWRIVERAVPQGLAPMVDGRDCYVFQRRDPGRPTPQWHVIPVATFWGVRR